MSGRSADPGLRGRYCWGCEVCARWGFDRRGEGRPRASASGPTGRSRLSNSQIVKLERELERGPLAHGWADQRWTLARVKTLIGRMFHVSCTVEGTWRLLKRHGWSRQQPTRRAIERDDDAGTYGRRRSDRG
uniref:helix-turn-helix domain-containing protein n=1 Tax=Streptomyces alanosinicus TaxID=68171 RepID=UPI0027E3C8CE|nr:winged helix-turn-helix domain-containing protein [Streptomyces alanosinicus]